MKDVFKGEAAAPAPPEVALETPDVDEDSMTLPPPVTPPTPLLLVDKVEDVMMSLPGEEGG